MRPIGWLLVSILIVLIVATSGRAQAAANETNGLPLVELVREVKIALLQVSEATEAQKLPKLDSAVLEVKTSMKVGGGR